MSITALHANPDPSLGFPAPTRGTPTAQTQPPAQQASMRKVVLLVGVAIAIFMAFTAYSVHEEIQGGVKLAAIKELYFPVLQRLDANVVRVDKLESTFIEVAVTGDRDLFDKARDVAQEADATYAEVAKFDPPAAADIAQLRKDLESYRHLAETASLAFLKTSGADTAPMQAMNDALAATRKNLTGLRQSVYDSFVQTLAESQHGARVRLIMGLSLGLMNLCFMAVLVYFIRNNIRMMAVIASQNATLEQRVAERTAQLSQKTSDINAMLQNMELGVCTVVPGNRIHPEYSKFLETIFARDRLADQELLASLFEKSNLGVDARDQIAVALGSILNEDPLQFAMNGHLLAREMQIADAAGRHKSVQMDWSPITNAATGNVDKVLLITQDVTQLRELQKSAASQQEELDIIAKILRISIGKFNDFIASAQGYLAANRKLLEETTQRDPQAIAALFRNMHTIKGNARTFEFTHITNAAHAAEQSYDVLRKDAKAVWDAAALRVELDAVQSAVEHYLHINEEKLGRKGRASDLLTTRGVFVGNDTLAELRSMAGNLEQPLAPEHAAKLRQAIDQLGLIPLQRIVSGAVDSISSLATELQKPTPAVDLQDDDIAFNSAFAEALKGCLVHMVRNSLDHGIESPADRLSAGKPEQGRLSIRCKRQAEQVELRISDDGRGLALHKLHAKGVSAGVFAQSERPAHQAIADLIFLAGLSTSNQVTQVSGRGVGMDAVRTFLQEQGARVSIALKSAPEPLGFVPFEFVIEVPRAACLHS